MHRNDDTLLFRMEAAGITKQDNENRKYVIKKLKRHGISLGIVLAVSLLISILNSCFPDGRGVLRTVQMTANFLFIVQFIRTVFYLFIFLSKNTKDYSGGFLEVYKDHIMVRQRSHFINNDSWESAEIWYEDLIRMWNTTDKSNARLLRLNRDVERFTDGICFRYSDKGRSRSRSAAKLGSSVFRLNCDGYDKAAILDAAQAVYNAALAVNSDFEYQML